jgi:hypothetical protein
MMSQHYAPSDPRKRSFQVAVGTAGPRGAAFASIAASWACPQCRFENHPSAFRCKRCRARRPAQDAADAPQQGDWHAAAAASAATAAAEATRWREAADPSSGHLYYFHLDTHESRWDRPAEMGPAPYATGWFGRGSAAAFSGGGDSGGGGGAASSSPSSSAGDYYAERNRQWLMRPAPKQVDRIEAQHTVAADGTGTGNIWRVAFCVCCVCVFVFVCVCVCVFHRRRRRNCRRRQGR